MVRAIIETVDEILSFRRKFLARPPFTDADDHILLRGSQEEMWQRILQLQFAVDPIEVVTWMGGTWPRLNTRCICWRDRRRRYWVNAPAP